MSKLQFRLRTLLIAVTLAAVAIALLKAINDQIYDSIVECYFPDDPRHTQ